MQSKKSCRFTAAFIGFLLLMLGIFALPVSAADTLGRIYQARVVLKPVQT